MAFLLHIGLIKAGAGNTLHNKYCDIVVNIVPLNNQMMELAQDESRLGWLVTFVSFLITYTAIRIFKFDQMALQWLNQRFPSNEYGDDIVNAGR